MLGDATCGELKTSGKEQSFSTGAVRDTADNKRQWHLVSPYFIQQAGFKEPEHIGVLYAINAVCLFILHRKIDNLIEAFYGLDGKYDDMIAHLEKGAIRYKPFNWSLGLPISRCLDSLHRHLQALRMEQTDEDHRAAAKCNIMFIVHYLCAIKDGHLPKELDDMPDFKNIKESLNQNK